MFSETIWEVKFDLTDKGDLRVLDDIRGEDDLTDKDNQRVNDDIRGEDDFIDDVLADEDLREQLRCEHDLKGEYDLKDEVDLKDEDGLRDVPRDEDNLTNAADLRV